MGLDPKVFGAMGACDPDGPFRVAGAEDEDGAVGGFVQRGVGTAREYSAVLEMGGEDTASSDTRATEASVRGFWKAYRRHMGV